jgi:hypothetical protein
MSGLPDSNLRELLMQLAAELTRAAEAVSRGNLFGKGPLKQSRGLYYAPSVIQTIEEGRKRIRYGAGSWSPEETYDENSVERFFQMFLDSSGIYPTALRALSSIVHQAETEQLAPGLYLTMFCHVLLERILKNESFRRISVESLITGFLKDVEDNGIMSSISLGIEGLELAEGEGVIYSDHETVLIRQPLPSDLDGRVLVAPRWDGDWDLTTIPSLPLPTSVIDVKTNSIRITPIEIGLIDLTLRSRIRIIGWLLDNTRIRINQARCILGLFQAKALPRFLYVDCMIFLKSFSEKVPVFKMRTTWEKPSGKNYENFVLDESKLLKLKEFWRKMVEVNCLHRVYSRFEKQGIGAGEPTPLEVAYVRYLAITSSTEPTNERMHDVVEALEALFTPSIPDSQIRIGKVFIPRVSKLMNMFDDPNYYQRSSMLEDAFKIRSEFSHSGAGWEEHYLNAPDYSEHFENDLQDFREREYRKSLLEVCLNYLRVAIIARIVAGLGDHEFVTALGSPGGIADLRLRLKGVNRLLLADPIPKIRRIKADSE